MTPLIVAIDAFLAVSGYVGGRELTRDPTGSRLHLSTQWLKQVPLVKDYKWPGVFLLLAYALGGSVAAVATFNRYPWAPEFNATLGLILVAWVIVELLFIPRKHFIQAVYLLLGLALVTLPRL
jgi:hypothetical protein